MAYEAEVPGLVAGTFWVMTAIFAVALVVLTHKTRRWGASVCFALYWGFTGMAIHEYYVLLTDRSDTRFFEPSIFYSVQTGLMGLFWVLSVFALLLGLYLLLRKKGVDFRETTL